MKAKPILKFVFGVCLGLLCAATSSLNAQEDTNAFVGKWNAVAETDEGEQSHVMVIKNGSDGLSGTITVDEGERELSNVAVKDGKLSFEFEMEAQGTDLLIKIVYDKSKSPLDGEWTAFVDGNEVANGSVDAERVVEKAKPKKSKSKLVGQWTSVAVLPDGNELESALELTGDDDSLSGTMVNDRGDKTEIAKVTNEDGSVRMEFEIEVQGELRDVVIEGELKKDVIEGEWVVFDDGEEAASGDWTATRNAEDGDAGEAKVLFDGSSLDNFRGYNEEAIGPGWKIEDRTLHFDGTKSGDIITKQEYGSFELEFEWKISEGGNSGVVYRVSLGDKQPYISGPEYQVLDDGKHKDSNPKSSAASLYGLYVAKDKKLKPAGEWNTAKIVVKDNAVEHWLNGAQVVSAEMGSDDWNERIENSKFKTWKKFAKNKKGHISFQDHDNPVWYRNIKIKSLD